MGWNRSLSSPNKSKIEKLKMMKIKNADKCSFAGTNVDSEPQPIDFRQPAYCQTPCYAPFSGSPSSELYNMDCVAGMKHYPDKYFDLAIVDPPYGIGQPKQGNLKGYNGRPDLETRLAKNRLNTGAGKLKDRVLNKSNAEWDKEIPSYEYFVELWRVSKERIIWGGNYFDLPPTRGIICWDKVQPWENFSQIEYAWTSFDKPAALFKFDNRTGNKIHPTQKPIKLYEWILSKYAEKDQRILDTHVGSGSSRIACYLNGFDFVGFEIDEDYCQSSEKRFRNAIKQQRLF